MENPILVLGAKYPSWGARAKGKTENATTSTGVGCSQHIRQYPEPRGLDQSAKEEEAQRAMLGASLFGHWPESTLWASRSACRLRPHHHSRLRNFLSFVQILAVHVINGILIFL
jgi:hypothetical protein